jgi:hypothetical protein
MDRREAYEKAVDKILFEAEPILQGEATYDIVKAPQYIPSLGDVGRELLGLLAGYQSYDFDTIVLVTIPSGFGELLVNIPFHKNQGFFAEFVVDRLGRIPHEAAYFRPKQDTLRPIWKTDVSRNFKGESTAFTEFLSKHDQLRRSAKKIRFTHSAGIGGSVQSRWQLQIIPTEEGHYVLAANIVEASGLFMKRNQRVALFMEVMEAVDAAVADFGYTGTPERCQIPIFSHGLLRNKQLQKALVQGP